MIAIIPTGLKGKSLYDFCVKNEALIVHAKKNEIKQADAVYVPRYFEQEKGVVISKEATTRKAIPDTATKLQLDVVINTTNYFDSHWDVHIPGLWAKSLADNRQKGFYLLKEHRRGFEDVIGEGLTATAEKLSWRNDLDIDFPGSTEALMFSGTIDKSRNEYMFGQYAAGHVKQHSVGMRYVKILTCINDDDYPVQKENWDKYIKMVVNASEAEDVGIFWAILEAKVVEGSAVLFGSNDMTPCYNVEDASTENEPAKATHYQPRKDVGSIDFSKLIIN